MSDLPPPPPPVITQELRIVDAQGRPRMLLSALNGVPEIVLLREDGSTGARVALDAAGRPALTLFNPLAAGPHATVEIDDKGAHLLLERPGGASSYLFLNDAGGSGVVLIAADGQRRLSATLAADGSSRIEHAEDFHAPASN